MASAGHFGFTRLLRSSPAAALFFLALLIGRWPLAPGSIPKFHGLPVAAFHPDGNDCPDPSSDGRPCPADCFCQCCPGHAVAVVFALGPLDQAMPPPRENETNPGRDLRSQDVLSRIFRPPRS